MPRRTHVAKDKDRVGTQARCPTQRTQVPSAQPLSHQVIQRAETDPGSLIPTDVLTLQRILGNRAVGQLLGRGRSTTTSPGPTLMVQRAMTVGAADDALEREAEDIAEKVMRRADRPDSGLDGGEPPGGQGGEPPLRTQRLVAPRDGAPDPDPAVGPDGGGIGGALEAGIRKMQGCGRPLDKEWRVPMEEATRQDYGDVRLHVNQESDRLNAALGARAFTVGKDIFMKSREYRPGSLETKKLVFHEMVHVGHQTNRHSLGKIQHQLDLDRENWDKAKRVEKYKSEGGSPIFFLYEKKKSRNRTPTSNPNWW